MKKTEKIEIRLSHEDKERLNKIAESEGRTISQIVRGLIDRYMDLNSASGVKKTPLKEKLIWGFMGALITIPVTLGTISLHLRNTKPTSSHQFSVMMWPAGGGVHSGGIGVPIIDGFHESFELHSEETKTRFTLSLTENDFAQYKLGIEICLLEEKSCQPLTGTSLSFDSNSAAETTIHDEFGNQYDLGVK